MALNADADSAFADAAAGRRFAAWPAEEIAIMRRQQGGRRGASAKEPQAGAVELAIAALGFLGAEPERLGRFLALTGIAPRSIRAAAREPALVLELPGPR